MPQIKHEFYSTLFDTTLRKRGVYQNLNLGNSRYETYDKKCYSLFVYIHVLHSACVKRCRS